MRQVVLDTETTGINPREGHRIVEIGCVELIDRKPTGRHYHQYINPQRNIDDEVVAVHGITNERVADEPVFSQIAQDFYEFVEGAELIIHNAPFDIGFLDHELSLLKRGYANLRSVCSVIDTLVMARDLHPGQKNNLDALCKRYFIDNSRRELHGALLDSEILADVYLAMTGGQTTLEFSSGGNVAADSLMPTTMIMRDNLALVTPGLTPLERQAHHDKLDVIKKASGGLIIYDQ